jgi:hypothetical protein
MKVRVGFVSNSSSSSFLIYGISMSESKIVDMMKEMFPEDVKEYCTCDEDSSYRDDIWEICEVLTDKLGEGFEFHRPDENGDVYVGKSLTRQKDEETGAEFKASVDVAIKKIFGDESKPDYLAEAWRDG